MASMLFRERDKRTQRSNAPSTSYSYNLHVSARSQTLMLESVIKSQNVGPWLFILLSAIQGFQGYGVRLLTNNHVEILRSFNILFDDTCFCACFFDLGPLNDIC